MVIIKNCCQISSLIFIINIIIGVYCNYYLYSLLFVILLITSLIHHSNYTDFTYITDKISCLYIVLYGILLFYQKVNDNFNITKTIEQNYLLFSCKNIVFISILISFIIVLYLYYYGYYNKQYIFDTDINSAFQYHSIIHYISCFAHSLIMLI